MEHYIKLHNKGEFDVVKDMLNEVDFKNDPLCEPITFDTWSLVLYPTNRTEWYICYGIEWMLKAHRFNVKDISPENFTKMRQSIMKEEEA